MFCSFFTPVRNKFKLSLVSEVSLVYFGGFLVQINNINDTMNFVPLDVEDYLMCKHAPVDLSCFSHIDV